MGHPPVDKHDVSVFFIIIMMIGANLGMKYCFQSEEEKKHLAKLREQSLKQELEYLRYQINPHFIMNTLNNIHALVDIDPEQAKDSIVDISRMMRYLLYDSDKHYVPLNAAVEFLKKYLNLMKLRYTDQVTINLDVPSSCSDNIAIVPLMFIPFVENAFKHGVALDKPSAINISIEKKDGRLLFHCNNTKSHAKHEYGGVGLNNVTKRLELIYGSDYSLDIKDGETDYDVLLNIPVKSPDYFTNNETRSTD
jgi:LytS/YehU family sensor histidine kinase